MLNPIEKFKRSILHLNRSLYHWIMFFHASLLDPAFMHYYFPAWGVGKVTEIILHQMCFKSIKLPVAVSCGYGTCFAVRTCDGLCHQIFSIDCVGIPFGFQPIVWTFVRHGPPNGVRFRESLVIRLYSEIDKIHHWSSVCHHPITPGWLPHFLSDLI